MKICCPCKPKFPFISFSTKSNAPKQTYHKRPLPLNLISLSSTEGKVLFREALLDGTMESFFPLSEQFITQSDPSLCSLSTLAMVLNALNHDPKKIWKGIWRWVTEDTLQCDSMKICGHSLDKVQKDGMNFHEFEAVARCHGVRIFSFRVDKHPHVEKCSKSLSFFRHHILQTSSSAAANQFIVANFSRKVIGQTGDGHFSPVGGYHASRDLVLIMDVARFKYPPFWVPLETLWLAMAERDKRSDASRGYFIVSSWNNNKVNSMQHVTSETKDDLNHEKNINPSEDSDICGIAGDITDRCPPLIKTWRDAKSKLSQLPDRNNNSCCATK